MQGNLVRIVDQAVEDRVGEGWIAQRLMPVFHRELAGDKRRPTIVAIFEQLQQVSPVFITERGQPPIIQNKQLGFGERRHQLRIAPVAFGQEQVLEQPGQPEVECRPAVTTRLMAQGPGNPGFADARRAREEDVAMVANPLTGREAGQQGFVQPTGMPLVEVFATGRLAQFRLAQAGGESPGIAFGQLPIYQEAEALFETEGRDFRQVQLLAEGFRHPMQAESLEFVSRRMREH